MGGLAIGTMNFGKRTPRPEALRIVARAIERGHTFFDTANVYEAGESERILGAALGQKRGECRIASKVGLARKGRKVEGLGREAVLRACDESLLRLGTDYLDVYYLHAPDYGVPIEETLGAIFDLVARKKIRGFGVSNFASWQILEIMMLCDRAGMARPAMSQQLYNLLIRQLDVEYFKFARRYTIHTTVYNALAGGLLAREHTESTVPAGSRFDKNTMYQRRYWSTHMFSNVRALRTLAGEQGMTLAELAYAWLAGTSGVDSILLGPASVDQLDMAIDACARTLPSEGRVKIDEQYVAFTGTDTTYAR